MSLNNVILINLILHIAHIVALWHCKVSLNFIAIHINGLFDKIANRIAFAALCYALFCKKRRQITLLDISVISNNPTVILIFTNITISNMDMIWIWFLTLNFMLNNNWTVIFQLVITAFFGIKIYSLFFLLLLLHLN